MKEILVLSLRALARPRRLLVIGALLAVPAVLAAVYQVSGTHNDGERFSIEMFGQLVLPILLPLAALVFATTALGGEIEDRTLIYLTLRPVSRLVVALAKLLSVVIIVVLMVEASLLITYVIAARGAGDAQSLGATLLAGLGGSVAYSSLFMLAGLIMPRRALLVGFVYVLVWEGIAAGFSSSLETWSVRRYVVGALHAALGSSPLASVQASDASGVLSATVLAAIVVAGIVLSTWKLHRLEMP